MEYPIKTSFLEKSEVFLFLRQKQMRTQEDKWNGEYPQVVSGDNTNMLIDISGSGVSNAATTEYSASSAYEITEYDNTLSLQLYGSDPFMHLNLTRTRMFVRISYGIAVLIPKILERKSKLHTGSLMLLMVVILLIRAISFTLRNIRAMIKLYKVGRNYISFNQQLI